MKFNRIGLDLDGVVVDWNALCAQIAETYFGYTHFPKGKEVNSWRFMDTVPKFKDIWKALNDNPELWLQAPALVDPNLINLLPVTMFITHRPISSEISRQWLDIFNIQANAPVITVKNSNDKVLFANNFDVFVDDKPETIRVFLMNGHYAYLMDQPWNKEATDLDDYRLTDLSDLL